MLYRIIGQGLIKNGEHDLPLTIPLLSHIVWAEELRERLVGEEAVRFVEPLDEYDYSGNAGSGSIDDDRILGVRISVDTDAFRQVDGIFNFDIIDVAVQAIAARKTM